MKKLILILLACIGLIVKSNAQLRETNVYLVYLKDKDAKYWNANDFDSKAIQRRQELGIEFPSWEDLPLNPNYEELICEQVDGVRHQLRWFNAISVIANFQQIEIVQKFDFVKGVEILQAAPSAVTEWEADIDAQINGNSDSTRNARLLQLQRNELGFEKLEAAGLSGKGVRIAVFDAGFSGADEHVAFAHLRRNNQILKTKDFINNGNVYSHSGHGTAVLGCIAGIQDGIRIGMAIDAEFLLARTEHPRREPISEEDNWLAAMEWADREGADIISSSLGYSKSRYTYEDMTGQKTIVSRAAALAVRKGILVVNSAGNEGAGKFHFISAPGDADSVLTVGASYPMMGYRLPFSSLGPNFRGVLKPEISAPGYILSAHKKGGFRPTSGTSFSCPLIAGIAACMYQKYPQANNMEIRQKLMEAASRYPYSDFDLGYGVFSAEKALEPVKEVAPTFEVDFQNDTIWFSIDPIALARDSANYKSGKPFSYRFVDEAGKINYAKIVLLRQGIKRFGLAPNQMQQGKLEAWFEGYYHH